MSRVIDLLRHGDTGLGPCFCGRLDPPLSARGWQQLQAALPPTADWAAIISSPLQRCAAFARQLAETRQRPLQLETDLQELAFGDWEGCSPAEVAARQPEWLERFWHDPWQTPPPAGERLQHFEARILAVLKRLLHQPDRQSPLLIITHGGVIRLLLARARGLERTALLQVDVPHAARFRLVLDQSPAGHLQLQELPCLPC